MVKKNLWINKGELLNKAKIKFLQKNPEKTKVYDYEVVEDALENYI